MKNKITAVIFDLDGVITSTDEYNYLSWEEIARELNIPFNRKINEQFRGISRDDCVSILLKGHKDEFDQNFKKYIADRKNEIYKEHLKKITPDFVAQDVVNTLKELKKRGYKMAIGSSSKNAPYILERIDCNKYFDSIVDGNQIKRTKPDPEVFLLAAEKIGKKPEECIVVGDATADIDAAIAGGMMSASISYAAKLGLGNYQLKVLSDLLSIANPLL